jgi:hypothetical protein
MVVTLKERLGPQGTLLFDEVTGKQIWDKRQIPMKVAPTGSSKKPNSYKKCIVEITRPAPRK